MRIFFTFLLFFPQLEGRGDTSSYYERVIYTTNNYYTLLKIEDDKESMTYGVLMDEMLVGLCYLHMLEDENLSEYLEKYRLKVLRKICASIVQKEFGENTPKNNTIIYTAVNTEPIELIYDESNSDEDVAIEMYKKSKTAVFILGDILKKAKIK